MIDMQAAAETIRQGGVWIDKAVIALVLTNLGSIGTFLVMIRRQRACVEKQPGGDTLRPGESDTCRKHAKKLDDQAEKVAKLEEWKSGAQGDLAIIKADIKTLLSRVPEREG